MKLVKIRLGVVKLYFLDMGFSVLTLYLFLGETLNSLSMRTIIDHYFATAAEFWCKGEDFFKHLSDILIQFPWVKDWLSSNDELMEDGKGGMDIWGTIFIDPNVLKESAYKSKICTVWSESYFLWGESSSIS
jgi:hypothetical protein